MHECCGILPKSRTRVSTTGIRGLLPKDMVPLILGSGRDSRRIHRCNEITKEQRRSIAGDRSSVSNSPSAGKRPVEEAIITHGGVKVSEVDPKTMESKQMPGAVFCRGGSGCGRLYRWL